MSCLYYYNDAPIILYYHLVTTWPLALAIVDCGIEILIKYIEHQERILYSRQIGKLGNTGRGTTERMSVTVKNTITVGEQRQ